MKRYRITPLGAVMLGLPYGFMIETPVEIIANPVFWTRLAGVAIKTPFIMIIEDQTHPYIWSAEVEAQIMEHDKANQLN